MTKNTYDYLIGLRQQRLMIVFYTHIFIEFNHDILKVIS